MNAEGASLGLAPLKDPAALAEWNRRAWALLGEDRGNVLEEWAAARKPDPAGADPEGTTDSFSRRQERIRRGEEEPNRGRSAEGQWELRRKGFAVLVPADPAEYPSNVVPLRRRAPRKEGSREQMPTAGEAWGRRESLVRGHRNGIGKGKASVAGERSVWAPLAPGEVSTLRTLRIRKGLTSRDVAELLSMSRSGYLKWENAANHCTWPAKEDWLRSLEALPDRAPDPPGMRAAATKRAKRAALQAVTPPKPEKRGTYTIRCLMCGRDKQIPKPRNYPHGVKRVYCDPCRDKRIREQDRERAARRYEAVKADPEAYRQWRQSQIAYYERKKPAILATAKLYHQRNRDHILERQRAWVQANAEANRRTRRAWAQANAERRREANREANRRYRARKREAQRGQA